MAGTVKAYGLPFDYVLYEMSYVNAIMYSAVLPSYRSKHKNRKNDDTVIRADSPENNAKVGKLLKTFD